MPEKIIDIPGVGRVSFPDSMTPEQMTSAAAKLHRESGGAVPLPPAAPIGSPRYAQQNIQAGKPASSVPFSHSGDIRATEREELRLNPPKPRSFADTISTASPLVGAAVRNADAIGNVLKGGFKATIGAISPIGPEGLRVPPAIDALLPIAPQDPNNPRTVGQSLRVPPAIDALLPVAPQDPNNPRTIGQSLRVPPIAHPAAVAVRGAGALAGLNAPPSDEEFSQAQQESGGLLAGALLPKVAPPAIKAVTSKLAANTAEKALNAATALAEPGVHGAPQPVAAAMQGRFAQTVRELIGEGKIPVKEGQSGGIMGDLFHGATEAQRANMARVLGKPLEKVGALATEAANKVVSDIHAPMRKIFADYAEVDMPVTARKIADKIRADGQRLAPPERAIWEQWANEVEQNSTVGGINHVKENANLAYAKLADRTLPSAQAEGTVSQAQAAKSTAEFIRRELYPRLEKVAPGLAEQGRLESQAWDYRDGVFKTWTEAAKQEAPAALRTWHEKFGIDALRGVLHPGKTTLYTAIKPSTFKTPLKKFNELMRKATTDVGTPASDKMLMFGGLVDPENLPFEQRTVPSPVQPITGRHPLEAAPPAAPLPGQYVAPNPYGDFTNLTQPSEGYAGTSYGIDPYTGLPISRLGQPVSGQRIPQLKPPKGRK